MIRLVGVRKQYGPTLPFTVKDVDLHVPPGALLVLLGGSGCGKTTTLRIINRLIEPTSGRVEINGKDTANECPVKLRQTIGYVIQGSGLFPHLSVKENIALVPRLLGWRAKDTEARVEELLVLVGLDPTEYRDRRPRELSGGQQQRIGFARALAARPAIMLLDEPFGALDPVVRDKLREDFQRIRREMKLTAVMVTHDMTEALLLADRIAVMEAGRVVRQGTPREVMAEPGHEYVKQLLHGPLEQTRQVERLLAKAPGGAA